MMSFWYNVIFLDVFNNYFLKPFAVENSAERIKSDVFGFEYLATRHLGHYVIRHFL